MSGDDPKHDKVWLRSERIPSRDDGWYIATPDGDVGPFPDRRWAVTELMQRYHRASRPHPVQTFPVRRNRKMR